MAPKKKITLSSSTNRGTGGQELTSRSRSKPKPKPRSSRPYDSKAAQRNVGQAKLAQMDSTAGPHREPPTAASVPEGPSIADLFAMLMEQASGGGGGGAGPAPNINDYTAGFGTARQNALNYQNTAGAAIQAQTADLVNKLGQLAASANQDQAASAAQAQQATAGIQGAQGAEMMRAAQDLQSQGISTAPLVAQQSQLGGQLQAADVNQQAFANKLSQLQAQDQAGRVASAQQQGAGALGTLGLGTQKQLGAIDMGEAEARRQYTSDAQQYAASAASGAGSQGQDLQTRLALATQFAELDNASNNDPTVQIRNAYAGVGEVQDLFDQLESGDSTPAQMRIQFRKAKSKEKAKPRESQNVDRLAIFEELEGALSEWEKVTRPDAKATAKNDQLKKILMYLQPR